MLMMRGVELKTGMLIEHECEGLYRVYLGTETEKHVFSTFAALPDGLLINERECIRARHFDVNGIIAIYRPHSFLDLIKPLDKVSKTKVWRNKTRQQRESKTMATICGIKLKSGMVLEFYDGEFAQVFMGSCGYANNIYSGPLRWGSLDNFDQDGSYIGHIGRDIVAIYKPKSNYDMRLPFDKMNKTEIWRWQPEIKEMTVAEVEAKLGHPIKIVKE